MMSSRSETAFAFRNLMLTVITMLVDGIITIIVFVTDVLVTFVVVFNIVAYCHCCLLSLLIAIGHCCY